MIDATARKSKSSDNVRRFKIGEFRDDPVGGQASGDEIENVDDSNSHASNTRAPTALLRVHRDAIHEFDRVGIEPRASKGPSTCLVFLMYVCCNRATEAEAEARP